MREVTCGCANCAPFSIATVDVLSFVADELSFTRLLLLPLFFFCCSLFRMMSLFSSRGWRTIASRDDLKYKETRISLSTNEIIKDNKSSTLIPCNNIIIIDFGSSFVRFSLIHLLLLEEGRKRKKNARKLNFLMDCFPWLSSSLSDPSSPVHLRNVFFLYEKFVYTWGSSKTTTTMIHSVPSSHDKTASAADRARAAAHNGGKENWGENFHLNFDTLNYLGESWLSVGGKRRGIG